jgi:hypothetical protein
MLIEANRFAGPVVNEADLRQAYQYGFAHPYLEFGLDAAANDLLGRDATYVFGPGTHELDAAAGYDKGFESADAQAGQQLKYRLAV